MPAKSDPMYPQVEASVVVISNDAGLILLDFNPRWGVFTLPVSKRRTLQPGGPSATPASESWHDAALRAAAEVLGQPFPPSALTETPDYVEPFTQSGRDCVMKRYEYRVFAMPWATPPQPVPGHVAVWVDRAAASLKVPPFGPLSPTVHKVLTARQRQ